MDIETLKLLLLVSMVLASTYGLVELAVWHLFRKPTVPARVRWVEPADYMAREIHPSDHLTDSEIMMVREATKVRR